MAAAGLPSVLEGRLCRASHGRDAARWREAGSGRVSCVVSSCGVRRCGKRRPKAVSYARRSWCVRFLPRLANRENQV